MAVRETNAEMADLSPKRFCDQDPDVDAADHHDPYHDQDQGPGALRESHALSSATQNHVYDGQIQSANVEGSLLATLQARCDDADQLLSIQDVEDQTEDCSISIKSSDVDEFERNEIHSTVYLPLLKHSSVHMLLLEYKHLTFQTTKIWVFSNKKCSSILQTMKDKDNLEKPILKKLCGHNYYEDQRQDFYVLVLPIEKQVRYFIEHHGLEDQMRDEDPNYRGDVNSGDMYRKLRREKMIDENTITVQLNLDGASCFKVSQYVFWPFMAIINEAP
ncbi:hypothetical protein OUZ56_018394 [Daphnia magna]|uniref:Uncharacterized protein n=1 Tax=Daphnia magna TaxID=35525 RepID=A0ABQ9Z8R9_9CRUS|nr:hypothetical protein OUZ56_018394 [Daphnia magna]